jgi:hypothetical protein
MYLVLAGDVHEMLTPSPCGINLGIERFFIGMVCKGERPAAGIANFAFADEGESTFLTHPIYGHHVHVIFQRSSIRNDIRCQT